MSIAGISSNFSALSTTDVQAAQQYTEDEQLLTESLQTQNLTNATQLSGTLLSSLQPTLNPTLTALSSNGSETGTTGNQLTALDENAASSPNTGIGISSSNTGAQTSNTGNTTQGTGTPPGALQSLAQTIRARAQQAYTTAQQGFPAANNSGRGTTGAILG
jgi:hypothetical protein